MQPTSTVGQIALETPGATRVFERLGIDYCCGGKTSLASACAAAGLAPDDVLSRIEREATSAGQSEGLTDFRSATLAELVTHIVERHHAFTRNEIERLDALLDKVCSAHGARHPELSRVRDLFRELAAELAPHMLKEERVLFPHIVRLEEAARAGLPAAPPPFVTVRNPVRVMSSEHHNAGELLRSIRRLSGDFIVPADGCISYRTLYGALEEFERDLHQHIHLENNVLFPRAVELESSMTV